jgi:hypothetical protein
MEKAYSADSWQVAGYREMPPPDGWRFADRECGLTVCKCPDFIFWSLCYAVRVTAVSMKTSAGPVSLMRCEADSMSVSIRVKTARRKKLELQASW